MVTVPVGVIEPKIPYPNSKQPAVHIERCSGGHGKSRGYDRMRVLVGTGP